MQPTGWVKLGSAVVIAGEADALMPPDRAVTLEQLYPIPGSQPAGFGHLPMMEAPGKPPTPGGINQLEQNHHNVEVCRDDPSVVWIPSILAKM